MDLSLVLIVTQNTDQLLPTAWENMSGDNQTTALVHTVSGRNEKYSDTDRNRERFCHVYTRPSRQWLFTFPDINTRFTARVPWIHLRSCPVIRSQRKSPWQIDQYSTNSTYFSTPPSPPRLPQTKHLHLQINSGNHRPHRLAIHGYKSHIYLRPRCTRLSVSPRSHRQSRHRRTGWQ